jgi:hypothetical protein
VAWTDVLVEAELQMSEARSETWRSIRDVEASVEATRVAVLENRAAIERFFLPL